MMTARVLSGASVFALLIVHICCLPVKTGFNPDAPYAATNFGSNQDTPTSQFSPGVVYNNAPSNVAAPSYQPAPQLEPSFSQPAVRRQTAASSGPTLSAYRGSSVSQNPASSTRSETFPPAPRDFNWAVPPPTPYSGGEERSAGSSGAENVSPPLPPPGPVYQAGELSYYAQSFEDGDSEMETEEQGYLLPPPPPPHTEESAGPGFTSEPQPVPDVGGIWGPYPGDVFTFLTGQFPQGTITYSSNSYEQGRDSWQESHYEKYDYPYVAGPAQQTEAFTGDLSVPQSFEDPRQSVKNPVVAGYGQGGAQASRFRQPTRSQAGRYTKKVGY